MTNKVKAQSKTKKYSSRVQLVEDVINWNELATIPAKEKEYVQQLKDIHANLLQTNAEKFPLADFVQKHKLSLVELFLLLRFSALEIQRVLETRYTFVPYLLDKGKLFGTRKELMDILLEGKSVLFDEEIIRFIGDRLTLKKNFLLALPSSAKHKTQKRLLNPQKVLVELNKFVIGQDEAKRKIVAGVFEHLSKCSMAKKDTHHFHKNNIFISGPTGSGKTYILQCLANILKIPFVHVDASQYSQTGYHGMDISSILHPLAKYSIDMKFPISIVFIDEIDKIHQGSEKYGSSSTNVQAELLRMIESNSYFMERSPSKMVAEVDISQVLFVVGGAFESLQITHADKTVGFAQSNSVSNKTLSADDYIRYGMLPELIGRFSYFVQLKGLEKEDLRKILINPYGGVIAQYNELFHSNDKKLEEEEIERIIDYAYEQQLGARGLNQQVGMLFQEQFLEQSIRVEI